MFVEHLYKSVLKINKIMEINTISPVFADFNKQIPQMQHTNNKENTTQQPTSNKKMSRRLANSLLALGIMGVASLGIFYLSQRHKVKVKYQAPKPKVTAPPPAIHLKQDMEMYLPSVMPNRTASDISKVASETVDDFGRTVRTRVFPSGSIEETIFPDGKQISRRIIQTIKRPDSFSDELDVFSLCDETSKKITGITTKDVGYDKIKINHMKEFVKDAKGKFRLVRRQKMEVDDILNPVHKIVEHLDDGTTKITLASVSNNTQNIITRDRKGNILSETFTFL